MSLAAPMSRKFARKSSEVLRQYVRSVLTYQGASVVLEKLDPNIVADLLKLYLLELPEPLVPYDNYNGLLGSRVDGTALRIRYALKLHRHPSRRAEEAGCKLPAG